jgi:hypothetical protein
MRYELRVSAYDVMDTIWINCVITSTDSLEKSPPTTVMHIAHQVQGIGESDPRGWLQDVLVALLELT